MARQAKGKSSAKSGKKDPKVAPKRRTRAGGRLESKGPTVVEDPSTLEIIDDPLTGLEPQSTAARAKRDADSMAGDESPGGTVAVPDNDLVDDWAGALGVERSPDSPVRGRVIAVGSHDVGRTHERSERVIRKLASGGYRLYSRKKDQASGKRKNLGTFKTRQAAEKHERAVQFFKQR